MKRPFNYAAGWVWRINFELGIGEGACEVLPRLITSDSEATIICSKYRGTGLSLGGVIKILPSSLPESFINFIQCNVERNSTPLLALPIATRTCVS